MRSRSFPDNLVSKILHPKHRIQHHLQVMAGGGVAVQVQAAGGLEHPVQFHQAGGHHHQVGHHLVGADELAHGADHGDTLTAAFSPGQLVIGALRRTRPSARYRRRRDLRFEPIVRSRL